MLRYQGDRRSKRKGGILRKTARLYFDEDLEWPDKSIADVQEHLEASLVGLGLGLTWDNVQIEVYYYGGGIEDSPDYGKYQRGPGFYADISTEMY